MRSKAPLLAVLGIVAFVATWLIMDESGGFWVAPPDKAPKIPMRQPDDLRDRTNSHPKDVQTEADETAKSGRAESTAAEETATGTIVATITDSKGEAIRDFALDLRPFSGQVTNHSGGLLEIKGVAEGTYILSVWASGKIRQDRPGVEVVPGKKTRVAFMLKSGFRPKGVVIDEKSRQPVPGVTIEFFGGGRCRSGSDGHFETAYDLAPGCLDIITVSHPKYDRFVYNRMNIPDRRNIVLAMTRGDSVIQGRIINRSGRALPGYYRLRLWMERGLNIPPEVRKERMFKPSETFRFEGVHRGLYQLMLEFPDSNLAARHCTLEVGFKDRKEIEFEISSGVELKGRLISRTKAPLVTKLELFNKVNLLAASIHSNTKGEFSFAGVEPGTWRIRAWRGSPVIDFSPIEVAGSSVILELDVDRQRMTQRSMKK
jgi:hypothetical protein